MTLRDLAEFEVNNRLLAVPGVAAVERLGGYLRQFQVQLDPERMSARLISLDDVMHAVEESNLNASGGIIAQGRSSGRCVRSAAHRRSTTCVEPSSRRAATCRCCSATWPTFARRRRCGAAIAHRLKGEVVSARVIKQFGADTVTVAAGIRGAVEDIRRALPKGVQLRIVYDQSQLVSSALGGVGRAVMLGGVFVVLVILMLLGNVRAALVVTFTIPLSIALAGLLLRPLGVGLNTMTLGGLAIAVGLLVDAAIIMVENILHRLSGATTRRERRERALAAATEVARPIAFATFIVIVVFLPLFGMTRDRGADVSAAGGGGDRGDGGRAHPGADARADRGGAGAAAVAPREDEDVALLRAVKRWYAPALDRCLRHPRARRRGRRC